MVQPGKTDETTREPKVAFRASFGKQVLVPSLEFALLVGFGWVLARWSDFQKAPLEILRTYFQEFYRVYYLVVIWAASIPIYLASPLFTRPLDEISKTWIRWRYRMWETVVVLSVFSDNRGYWLSPDSAAVRLAGAAAVSLALGLKFAATIARRKTDQLDPEADFPLKGIYQVIRFPEYLGWMLESFGIALVFNSWAGLFVSFLASSFLLGALLEEDRRMLRKFKERWLEYQQKVNRLIPYIW